MAEIILVQEEPRSSSVLIEVPIVANQQIQKFPIIQQLLTTVGQTIIIKEMRLITPKVLTNAVTINGTNALLTELRKMAVTIYCEGWEKGKSIPILLFNDFADNDSTAATTIPYRNHATKLDNWRNVDWNQSYIQFANGTAPAGVPYVVMFDIVYVKLNATGQEIIGPS